jgi:hypothetical protein
VSSPLNETKSVNKNKLISEKLAATPEVPLLTEEDKAGIFDMGPPPKEDSLDDPAVGNDLFNSQMQMVNSIMVSDPGSVDHYRSIDTQPARSRSPVHNISNKPLKAKNFRQLKDEYSHDKMVDEVVTNNLKQVKDVLAPLFKDKVTESTI